MTDEGKKRIQEELSMKRQRDMEKIMNMNYKNIAELQTMEFLES